jgi:hypothetical protein
MAKEQGDSGSSDKEVKRETDEESIKPVSTAIPTSDALDDTSSILSDPPDIDVKPKRKPSFEEQQPLRKKQMTVEEYEAMLDAEDGEGGFLEAGDIAP